MGRAVGSTEAPVSAFGGIIEMAWVVECDHHDDILTPGVKCFMHRHGRAQCGTEARMFHFGSHPILWTVTVSGLTTVLYVGVVYVQRNSHTMMHAQPSVC